MQYVLVGGIGTVVVIFLGIFLSRWDNKRHAQTQEMIRGAQEKNNKSN